MADFIAGGPKGGSTPNVANAPSKRVTEHTRVPMSVPTQRLAVPEIPGYFLYWHRSSDVKRAIDAGYEFVNDDEMTIEQKGVANDASTSGNTDMGTRISIAGGGTVSDDDPSPLRLYLMKLRQEWRDKDDALRDAENEKIASALRAGQVGSEKDDPRDRGKRVLKEGQDLFTPKPKRPAP